MKILASLILTTLPPALLAAGTQLIKAPEMTAQAYTEPPIQYRSRPFYWLNGKLESTALREQIQSMRDQCGFGGFAPLAMRSTQPAYLSDGYYEQYGLMLHFWCGSEKS